MKEKINNLQDLIKVVEKVDIPGNLQKVSLENADNFLGFINASIGKRVTVDEFQVLAPWAILVLASIGRGNENVYIENKATSSASKFAYSLGLNDILSTEKPKKKNKNSIEPHRTVKLCELTKYEDIEPISEKISQLIIEDFEKEEYDKFFESEEVKKTIRYVLIELLRNVVQHSHDQQGALVIAQKDKANKYIENGFIQIAVADRGIGIYESIKTTRKDVVDEKVALEKSLWPGVSGKFYEYEKGSAQNAGMGLFFVSEMAKLTSGEFFIASRGASLHIKGDPNSEGNNLIYDSPIGYPGTLVVFEMPKRGVSDYDELIKKIQQTARIRRNIRHENQWIRFDIPKERYLEFYVDVAAEDTVKAQYFAEQQLIPRITRGEVLRLNFTSIPICTQSFLHSLLFQAVNLAYKLKIPLYVTNFTPSVRDGIRLVEMYGLNAENTDSKQSDA